MMDIGTFRGILTAVLLVLFVGIVIWAFSRKRHTRFEEAAQLPLEDDRKPPSAGPERKEANGEQDR